MRGRFGRRVQAWRGRLRALERETYALLLACRDGRTPWYAKLAAGAVVAYVFSPIDLIPDFIPVLGYADDALVVAIALRFATRRAGTDAVARHWPGTPEGLAAILRLAGLTPREAVAGSDSTSEPTSSNREAPA